MAKGCCLPLFLVVGCFLGATVSVPVSTTPPHNLTVVVAHNNRNVSAAAAAATERGLFVVGGVSLGLGNNEQDFEPEDGFGNVGPVSQGFFGFEISWIIINDINPRRNKRRKKVIFTQAVVHDPIQGLGDPPSTCPNTLALPENSAHPRGVSYFKVRMETTSIVPPGRSNSNIIGLIYDQEDCKTRRIPGLPKNTVIGLEYTHVLSIVFDVVQSNAASGGCEEGEDTRYDGISKIYRPLGTCESDGCNQCRGVSFFQFLWKDQDSMAPTTSRQCFVSGNAAQDPAQLSDLLAIFHLADIDDDGRLDIKEFARFWKDVQIEPALSKKKLIDWYLAFDGNHRNNGITQPKFAQTLEGANLFSLDNVVAYQMLWRCRKSRFRAPGCAGYKV